MDHAGCPATAAGVGLPSVVMATNEEPVKAAEEILRVVEKLPPDGRLWLLIQQFRNKRSWIKRYTRTSPQEPSYLSARLEEELKRGKLSLRLEPYESYLRIRATRVSRTLLVH